MEKILKPKNLTELTDDLSTVYAKLRNQDRDLGLNYAKEINNTAGKIIKAVSTQVAFRSMIKSKEDVPYAH